MSDPWSFACLDWQEKLKRGETPIPNLPLNLELAEIAVELFDKLRLPDIPGQPTMAEAMPDWVRDLVRAAFGSIDENGERKVGELFNLIPKKNGKTTIAAALGLVALQMNTTPNIEGVIIGPTQKVAEKCFAQARGMIEADPYLSRRFQVIDHRHKIVDLYPDPETGRKLNAVLEIKSFDLKVVTGGIPAFAIIDELHVMAKSTHASGIIAQIRGGMVTNEKSLLVFITTQSDTPPSGAFQEELNYARGVRDGRITEEVRMLPVLYEFPESVQRDQEKPWQDVRLWSQVLPSAGYSFKLERLAAEYETARQKGPEAERIWASQHLNIQIGMALHHARWTGADHWEAAARPGLTLEEILESSDVVTMGGDIGGADDLFSMSVVGRHAITRVWQAWVKSWCLENVFLIRKSIAERLRDFERHGDLVVTETAEEHVEQAVRLCQEIASSGLLPDENAIGLDPWGVAALYDGLEGAGLGGCVVGVHQGYRLTGTLHGLDRRLYDQTFVHCDQPIFNWAVSNAKAEKRGNNVLITKETAGTGKIDPLLATINAGFLMSANPELAAPKPTIEGFLREPVMAI